MKYRYFIKLSYKGTHFHGWQIQPNAISVQEVLTKAFCTILRENIEITGAGRTDTGVHAINFIAHFDSEKSNLNNDEKFLFKLNSLLPREIAVHNVSKVKQDAHARFDAISRTYHYHIHTQKDPFLLESSSFMPYDFDINAMNRAAKLLFNFTDFTSFSKLHTDVKTNNCKITEAFWTVADHRLKFTVSADRFLRNMVRAIVGTLIEIGKGKLTINDFITIIESKNRSNAGVSVPAQGLFLVNIKYPSSIYL
jgi:tRNA pseudouridine38-40 synthase